MPMLKLSHDGASSPPKWLKQDRQHLKPRELDFEAVGTVKLRGLILAPEPHADDLITVASTVAGLRLIVTTAASRS